MEEHRGNAAKEVPRRIRGKAEEGKRPTGGPTGVASSSRGPADAGPSAVSGTAPVVDVISKVTSTFGHEEVEPGVSMEETLADPKLRASAAKWRSGSDGRRATALLARLLNGIHSIKPSWLDGSPAVEPQPVRTLPVREAIHMALGLEPIWFLDFGPWLADSGLSQDLCLSSDCDYEAFG